MKKRRLIEVIPELKDYYSIDINGKIYSDNSGEMKTRNCADTKYQIVNLTLKSGKKRTYRLHRLVMMAFAPIDNMDAMEVNHKDGNKLNNKFENLEWCNASYNQKHAFSLGLQKPRCGETSNFAKLSSQDVNKIFEMKEQGYTQEQIAKYVNCSRANISYILNQKTWQIGDSTTIPKWDQESSDSEIGNS